jgi:hypothetical protein
MQMVPDKIPRLIFDQKKWCKWRGEITMQGCFSSCTFQLLPEKFTLPQLHSLYEDIFNASTG